MAPPPPAEAELHLRAVAVPHGVLMAAPGRVVVALLRPSGEVVVHHRPGRLRPLAASWAAWPLVRGLLAWGEALQLLLLALTLSFAQLGGGGRGLAPAALGLRGPSGGGRQRSLLALAVGVAALSLGGVPVGIYRAWRLVWADTPQALTLACWRGLVWVLAMGALAALWRLTALRRWRMHHAAGHMALLAYRRQVRLEARAVRHLSDSEGPCSCVGLGWFLSLAGLFAAMCSLTPPVRAWSQHLGASLAVTLGWGVLLAAAWDVGQATEGWASRGWGQAWAWPGRWLQRRTLLMPDAAALEVALVALRAALQQNGAGTGAACDAPPSAFSGLADACARRCEADAG